MKSSTVLLLLVIAILLGGAALVLYRSTESQTPPGLDEWRAPLLKEVPMAKLASLALAHEGQSVRIMRRDHAWHIEDRFGYPADTAKLRRVMDTLRQATLLEAVPVEGALFDELELGDGQGATLTLAQADGTPLFRLQAGARHMKKPDGPEMAFYGGFPDGRYVRTDRGCFLLSDPLDFLEHDALQWLDKTFLQVSATELASCAMDEPGQTAVRVRRGADGTGWELENVPPGRTQDVSRLSRVTDALAFFSFQDVADPALPDEITGLASGRVFTATATNGLAFTVRIGNPLSGGDSRYVKLGIAGPDPLPESAAALQARLSPWIYQVADSQTEAMRFTLDDLLVLESTTHTATGAAAATASSHP